MDDPPLMRNMASPLCLHGREATPRLQEMRPRRICRGVPAGRPTESGPGRPAVRSGFATTAPEAWQALSACRCTAAGRAQPQGARRRNGHKAIRLCALSAGGLRPCRRKAGDARAPGYPAAPGNRCLAAPVSFLPRSFRVPVGNCPHHAWDEEVQAMVLCVGGSLHAGYRAVRRWSAGKRRQTRFRQPCRFRW